MPLAERLPRPVALPLAAAALLLLLLPAAARAENYTITSGSVTVGGAILSRNAFRSISFDFSGPGIAMRGGTGDGNTQPVGSGCKLDTCASGTAVSANGTAFLSQGVGFASLNGQDNFVNFNISPASMQFSGPGAVIPVSDAPTVTITIPFTMTGAFQLVRLDDPTFSYFASGTLSGQGLATLTFVNFPSGVLGRPPGFILQSIRYDFAPAEVPEPATLLLLGSGLAGLAARRRRRRRTDADAS